MTYDDWKLRSDRDGHHWSESHCCEFCGHSEDYCDCLCCHPCERRGNWCYTHDQHALACVRRVAVK